jgi:hypothetical protein
VISIEKQLYACFLNGQFYGTGDLDYMRELFVDYVVTMKMYDRSSVDFRITKTEKVEEIVLD